MVTLDRLFHFNLTHFWDPKASRYEARTPEKFAQIFSQPQNVLATRGVAELIKNQLLFPKDEQYVNEAAQFHQNGALFVTIATNVEIERGGLIEIDQVRQEMPLDQVAIDKIVSLIPQRVAFDMPLLAEVEIFLSHG